MFATSDVFFVFFLGFVLTLIITIAAFLLIRSCKFCWQNNKLCEASGSCCKPPGFIQQSQQHNANAPMPFIIFMPTSGKGVNSSAAPPIGSGYYTGPPTFTGPQQLQVSSLVDSMQFAQEYLPGGFYMTLIEDECYGGPPGSCQAFKIVPTAPPHEGPHIGTSVDDSHDCMTHSSSHYVETVETPETLSTSDDYGSGISFGGGADDMANFV